ncbi:RNA polymerase sigma-70 factor [Muricauda sp. HICW]|uniref:RNA polymerase sigma-70 factor n=1 Tax=Flagellimonas chongwuensis TaxID=2697365 RepID=A0A850NL01_9FLAO|nr:RNA polymerase sigma-70 factor [Allomuricauda chongwuensis]NVN19055.1 RNA polymerase sigma-70 factor [Allomuricauda chongwuensis]
MKYNHNKLLVKDLNNGKEKAYEYLVDTYGDRMYAYALTLVKNPPLAKDIVQNVFLNTWKFRKKLSSEYEIKNFLFKSVHNEFITQYQKDKSQMVLQYKYIETLDQIIEETDESSIIKMIKIVYNEIEKLPPKCKEVFYLSKKEGLTNNEISLHLGISVKTVEAQITKAFQILRVKLGEQFESIFILVFGKPLLS